MKILLRRLFTLILAVSIAFGIYAIPSTIHVSAQAVYTLTNGMAAADGATSVTTTPTASWEVGDYVIAVTASDTALTTYKIAGLGAAGADLTLTADATGSNAGNVVCVIWSGRVLTAGSNKLVTFSNATSDVKCCIVYRATGLANPAVDRPASSTGSSNNPSSGATAALTQADEIIVAGIGQEDDNDANSTGTWSGSFTAGTYSQKTGVDSGSTATDIVVQGDIEFVTATTAVTAAKTGITSCDWGAACATYKLANAIPSVTTQAVSSIAATTATGNGTVVNRGVPSASGLTERGVCYSSANNPPTTADSTVHDHTDSTGAYTESLTSLTEGTLYYCRAYAINATGTAYGSTVQFYTLPATPSSLASPSQTSSSIDLTWTKGTGSDKTLIRLGTSGYPSSITDGSQVYLDTGTSATASSYGLSKNNQQTVNNQVNLYSGSSTRVAEKFTNFPVCTITSVSFEMVKQGSPSGDLEVYIRKVSDDSVIGYLGYLTANSLGTHQFWDISGNVSNTIVQDIYISCEYSGGSVSNYVAVFYKTSDNSIADGIMCTYTSSWVEDPNSSDINIKVNYTVALQPSTTYYIRAWAVDTDPTPDNYSATTADLTQATAAGATPPSIANSPTAFNLGILNPSSTYYAKGSAPQNPVVQGDCSFYLTVSDATADVYFLMNDFTGGVGWNIASGAPGSNEVKMIAYYVGQNPASGLVLSNAAQLFKADVAAGTLYWDFQIDTGTFTDGANKTGILVISVTAA